MPLLRMPVHEFVDRCRQDTLAAELAERHRQARLGRLEDAEIRSWRNSLPALADVLDEAGLRHVEVLIEYQLALSSLRADVVLAGWHPSTTEPSYVIVELKQWTHARALPDTEDLCLPGVGNNNRAFLHPVAQVRRYCQYLQDFTATLDAEPDAVAGLAYLHNADTTNVADLLALEPDDHGRLFTHDTRDQLITHLQSRLSPAHGTGAADALLDSPLAPSRPLLRATAEEILHADRFVLLDEQQVAVSLVRRAVKKAREADGKEVLIVTGGPGSGKSVIALHLMRHLAHDRHTVVHATGSKSFTRTLHHAVGTHEPRVRKLFSYFMHFADARKNGLDALICDEAHRIRAHSVRHRGVRQIDELLDAARVPVFLLDDHQVVRPGEMGSREAIDHAAAARGLRPRHIDLDGQFRNGGSRAYEQWVLRLLQLTDEPATQWADERTFHVQVVDSPQQMEDILRAREDQHLTARITAGFCWPWSDPRRGRLVDDITIGSWSKPWNLRGDSGLKGVPPSWLWATDPDGFGQVGCIYTAQGFEYDWNGVIFGDDFIWRQDRWLPNPRANRDPALSRTDPATFLRLVRNTYKVLLTRGMAGTLLYSTDPETQARLRLLVPTPTTAESGPHAPDPQPTRADPTIAAFPRT
ncbi:DNA/RNA helicase domain-containing protein [Streptomyces sp. NPDC059447]|uniref:DNA/RNA helicase domain-containing protein n=1 Tax=Streptomyces sp. NPDC059447 TaxID=3346834 RepID=UPI003691741F